LEASYTPSKLLWTLIQETLEPQIIHNRNFRWHTCYQYELAELLNDKICNWNFQNRVFVIFGYEQEMHTRSFMI